MSFLWTRYALPARLEVMTVSPSGDWPNGGGRLSRIHRLAVGHLVVAPHVPATAGVPVRNRTVVAATTPELGGEDVVGHLDVRRTGVASVQRVGAARDEVVVDRRVLHRAGVGEQPDGGRRALVDRRLVQQGVVPDDQTADGAAAADEGVGVLVLAALVDEHREVVDVVVVDVPGAQGDRVAEVGYLVPADLDGSLAHVRHPVVGVSVVGTLTQHSGYLAVRDLQSGE